MIALHLLTTTLLVLSSLRLTLTVTCVPNPGLPPITPHCIELISKLLLFSRRPGSSIPKRWGRSLENTATSVHLPKTFWVTGDGPRTCGVVVDTVFEDFVVTEMLTVVAVAYAAERILGSCLLGRGLCGVEQIGAGKKVVVSLVRLDKDVVLVGKLPKGNDTSQAVEVLGVQ